MQLDDGIDALLSTTFTASDSKLGREHSSLRGSFWGVHRVGDRSSEVDEHMLVELRLLRPRASPRSWKWMLQFHLWATAAPRDRLQLATVQIFYTPSSRIGQLGRRGHRRGHALCEQHGRIYSEDRETIRAHGVCACKVNTLTFPKLATVADGVLCLSSYDRNVFTWTLSHEAVCVLKLVRSFV